MTATIQLRRGNAADWTTANPTLAAGEVGVELDTHSSKIGDGTTTWSTLPYNSKPGLVTDAASTNPSGDYAVLKNPPNNPMYAHYGAKFDGTTDDTAAIQSCINDAATSTFGEILIPGHAVITASLTVPYGTTGLKIIGLGQGKSRIQPKWTTAQTAAFYIGDNRNNVDIADLEIDMTQVTGGTGGTNNFAVYVITASAGVLGFRLRRVYAHGGPQWGIRYQNNGPAGTPLEVRHDDVRIENFSAAGAIGLFSSGFSGVSAPGVTRGRFYGGWVKGSGSDNFQFNNVADVELHGVDCTDSVAGHGCVFSGVQLTRFTYNSTSGSNTITTTAIATGTPAIGQTLAGGIGIAGLGVIPTGATITAVSGSSPTFTITMSANALTTVTGAQAVSGYFSHNIRVFGGEFSRNDAANSTGLKIGLVFSLGSYDFQAIAPRCDANGWLGLSVDTADNTFDQIVYDCRGRIVAPICTNSVGAHGIYCNWAADGLAIVAPHCSNNKLCGIQLVGSRATIMAPHLYNNGQYGWASNDATGHTGAPPCGGHKLYAVQAYGNVVGDHNDVASVPSTVV
jgi:hypothetical protein